MASISRKENLLTPVTPVEMSPSLSPPAQAQSIPLRIVRKNVEKIRYYSRANIERMPYYDRIPEEIRRGIRVVSAVLPFKVNHYVVEQLIDWSRVPDDPIFRLSFPHPDMLSKDHFDSIAALIDRDAPADEVRDAANRVRMVLNPHPAGQMEHNVPTLDGKRLWGMQHKYRETVLFFAGQGQTCHSYCTFCFRWAQFVGMDSLRFANKQVDELSGYLSRHSEVTDVLFTGGDPMIMPARILREYLEALLEPALAHVQTVRIGTKSLAWWPQRYVTDEDADEVLRLFERLVKAGKHVAIMAHNNHPREIQTEMARTAIRRIRATGAQIRCQSPLVRHINDDGEVWARMWREQVRLGCVPYYMFVERDTGPKHYFEVPLARALDIFTHAYRRQSGLGRTVRGPSMSATPGKVLINGAAEIAGEKVFLLQFIQARNPEWVGRPFFALWDEKATWLDHLKPAFGESGFFYQRELAEMLAHD
jgi:KamA family protein